MKVKIIANKDYRIGDIDKRIYGSFIEHLGRAVYGGIYEPDHSTADELGFRGDVMELVKELNVPIIRYPGGNFVSGYNWTDGIGEKSKRPTKLEPAWKSIEPNQVGIDDFQEWARRVGSEVMMAVNLGTGTPQDAQNLLEYCNVEGGTYYADMRIKNGFDKPFGIKTWCLGNEMDGPWQIGHKTPVEYGRIAAETGKLMKWIDPDIELVACGSSGFNMYSFGEWELSVLDHAYEYVDYISMHQYYGNRDENFADYMGRAVHMDEYIKSVAAICDTIKAKKHSDKRIDLSFDEWNVWFHTSDKKPDNWEFAPSILEDIYNFEDALLVGGLLITLQNNCDRVKIACLAQLVNVIAPIMTKTGGGAWAQTIFYPYMYSSLYGRGEALQTLITCESYKTTDGFTVPFVSASVINDVEKRELRVFAVNRSPDDSAEIDFDLQGFCDATLIRRVELYSDDLKAINSEENQPISPSEVKPSDEIILKKHSWNMLVYKY